MVSTSKKKKLLIKNNTFSFRLKVVFPLAGMKNSLKNIRDSGRKLFPLARKSVSTGKSKVCL